MEARQLSRSQQQKKGCSLWFVVSNWCRKHVSVFPSTMKCENYWYISWRLEMSCFGKFFVLGYMKFTCYIHNQISAQFPVTKYDNSHHISWSSKHHIQLIHTTKHCDTYTLFHNRNSNAHTLILEPVIIMIWWHVMIYKILDKICSLNDQ